ncbi:MAG: IS4 family transposase [Planctomycetota bacterium]|nr:IS4 family transposase [Planctomycetota bacterium]MDA1214668.1 IS4 family transposase [Planctomycetota bacterium]
MYSGQLVFAQLMEFLPRHEFNACVRRYGGNRRLRNFSCRDQFLTMAFAQLTFRESLRDIETCLRALEPKLYHAGFRGRISRSTLADANRSRDWRMFADFAQVLIGQARRLYAGDPLATALDETVYALDSTTIDLCLSLFPWAKFRRRKGAVKLHTLLDLRGCIPTFIHISHGKTHDVAALDYLPLEPGEFYVMDRGYVDFARLRRFTLHSAFFVTRAKRNLDFTRRAHRPVDKTTGLRSDQTIMLAGPKSLRLYPEALRRIAYFDAENDRRFVFLTNNFTLPALTIAELYKSRWGVELFFKWIKQHLRIKSFFGTSPNAVKTQVWIAISVYVLVAIVKRELRIERSLSEILQILSLTLFEKTPIFQTFTRINVPLSDDTPSNQLTLFDL